MGQEGICSSCMVHSVTRTPKLPGSRKILSSCLGYLNLGCQSIPQLDGEISVRHSQGGNKCILKRLDCSLSGVDTMIVWFNEL
jgi:hypothetical protein